MSLTNVSRLATFFALFLAASPLFAEVMDKEPSRSQLLTAAVIGGAIGFLASRFKPPLVLVVLPLSVALPLSAVLETYDRFVGPLIRREAGMSYVVEAHAALAVVVLANIAGAIIGTHRGLKKKGANDSGRGSPPPTR